MRFLNSTSRRTAVVTALAGAAWALSAFIAPPATAGSSLVIRDFVLTHGIYEREPVGTTDSFSIDDGRAYAFVRIANDGDPTKVSFIWMYGSEAHANIPMNVGSSSGWRTWSSVNIKPGKWRVDVVSAEGTVLAQRSFMVDNSMSQTNTSSNSTSRSKPATSPSKATNPDKSGYGGWTGNFDG